MEFKVLRFVINPTLAKKKILLIVLLLFSFANFLLTDETQL